MKTNKSKLVAKNPKAIQEQMAVQDTIPMVVTHVDAVRRAVRVSGIGRTQEVWVRLPEGADHLDLPPAGEGWQAIVRTDLAEPYVLAFLPPNSDSQSESLILNSPHATESPTFYSSESITNTNKQYRSVKANVGKNYRYDKPIDSIPGDKGFWGIDGNLFGVFRGKLNISKVSNSVSWFQSAYHKLTRIVTNKLDLFTSWGTIRIQQDKDLVRLEAKVSDKHSKARVEKYDAFLEIGSCRSGNNFLSFKLLHADNMSQPLTITIDNKGECEYTIPETFQKRIQKNEIKAVGKNSVEHIGQTKQIDASHIAIIARKSNQNTPFSPTASHPEEQVLVVANSVKVDTKSSAGILLGGKSAPAAHKALVTEDHLARYYNLAQFVLGLASVLSIPTPPGVTTDLDDYSNDKTDILKSQ